MTTRYLTAEHLASIGRVAMNPADPSTPKREALVRDYGLLEAASARPRASVFGRDAYPSVFEKAAALLHSIVSSHPLVDGNKRLGWLSCYTFLAINGRTIDNAGQDDVFELVMAIADGTLGEISEIADELRRLAEYDGEVPGSTEVACGYCGSRARADEMAHTGYDWTDSGETADVPYGVCRDCASRHGQS